MDHDLFNRCKNKDRNAQRQLYEQYANGMYNICKRYLKNDQDAEEVLADSFYTIFTKIHQLQNWQSFDGWARKIVVNQALQKLRQQKQFDVSLDDSFVEPQAEEQRDFSGEKDILSLLNFLPEGCKAIFSLFAIEGYPHKEIATMLSISEGTSKSQVNFARKKLQEMLHYQNVSS